MKYKFIEHFNLHQKQYEEDVEKFQKELNSKMTEFKSELIASLKTEFISEIKSFFDKYDFLEHFEWTQYTDYWNDGEELRFRVYANGIDINGIDYYDFCSSNIRQIEKNKERNLLFNQVSTEITAFIVEVPTELLEYMFGDHVKIAVTKDGIDVISYTNHE